MVNYTTPLTITINDSPFAVDVDVMMRDPYDLNSNMCDMYGTGVYERDTRQCYYNWRIAKVCVVVDVDEATGAWRPVDGYRDGCGPEAW